MFNMHIATFPSLQRLLSLFYFCFSTSSVKILYLLGFQWFCSTFLIITQPFHSSLHPSALNVVGINKWSDGDLHNCHKDCQRQHNSLRINIGRKERQGFSTEAWARACQRQLIKPAHLWINSKNIQFYQLDIGSLTVTGCKRGETSLSFHIFQPFFCDNTTRYFKTISGFSCRESIKITQQLFSIWRYF